MATAPCTYSYATLGEGLKSGRLGTGASGTWPGTASNRLLLQCCETRTLGDARTLALEHTHVGLLALAKLVAQVTKVFFSHFKFYEPKGITISSSFVRLFASIIHMHLLM